MAGSRAKLLAAALLLSLSWGAQAGNRHARSEGEPGRFDYYAVALSWSPAFCATHDDPNQCAPGRQAGFVLHGLWPQYAQYNRGYPQSCSTERLSNRDIARYAPLYPSPKMIGHEWSKHGTCSGLNPAAYFELSAKLRDQLRIPPAFQRPAQPLRTSYADFTGAFKAANPRLPDNAVLPFCAAGGRFLSEIHACYDKAGSAMACGAAEVRRSRNTCRQGSFLIIKQK
ncbi:MAG: ribonuclease family protein [Massilia sp.]|jgi:ribonuclease T2|nr:ribonuclease family protein [Massilia sp.]